MNAKKKLLHLDNDILPIHTLKDGYNEVNLRTTVLPVHRYVKKIEYFMDIGPGETVVDFGCGDGAVTEQLAIEYPDSHFIGIDYSEELIEYARKNHAHNNIEYVVANLKLEKLPIVDGSVDKVLSWGVMQYVHPKLEYEKYQMEFLRILKSAGRICHFQIPLRYGCLYNRVDSSNGGVASWLRRFKQFIKDIYSCESNRFSYKYSRKNLLVLAVNFSSVQIIPDDFFLERISVIYNK
jgi:ubiquinone/menaquinone biosynthesis C-methylase UbiE